MGNQRKYKDSYWEFLCHLEQRFPGVIAPIIIILITGVITSILKLIIEVIISLYKRLTT
jgi:hypothetical protein